MDTLRTAPHPIPGVVIIRLSRDPRGLRRPAMPQTQLPLAYRLRGRLAGSGLAGRSRSIPRARPPAPSSASRRRRRASSFSYTAAISPSLSKIIAWVGTKDYRIWPRLLQMHDRIEGRRSVCRRYCVGTDRNSTKVVGSWIVSDPLAAAGWPAPTPAAGAFGTMLAPRGT